MEIDKLITMLHLKKYEQVNCHRIHKALLNSVKKTKEPNLLKSKFIELKKAVEKAFREVERKKTAIKDDLICLRISLETLLGNNKAADSILKKITKNEFKDINKTFVEKRGFDYFNICKTIVNKNKTWRKALLNKKKGTSRKKTKSKKKNSNGFMSKIKSIFGL